MDFQERLLQDKSVIADWELSGDSKYPSLLDVVSNAQTTVLIGASGVPGLFTQQVVETLYKNCGQPIIFPLSNPSRQVEAHPKDVIKWTEGNAIVATGSPFSGVSWNDREYKISQCNNSYIFPGIGLGVIATYASRITDEMLMVASTTLAELAPDSSTPEDGILPPLTSLADISKKIAFNVGKMAMQEGVCLEITDEDLSRAIDRNFWSPAYREYRRVAMRAR